MQPCHVNTIAFLCSRRGFRVYSRYENGFFGHGIFRLMALLGGLLRVLMRRSMFPVTALTFRLTGGLNVIFIILARCYGGNLIIRPRAGVKVARFLYYSVTVLVACVLVDLVSTSGGLIRLSINLLHGSTSSTRTAGFRTPRFLVRIRLATRL